ncbi:NmrA/HSCARG family protein [Microbacterium sp. HD4P20]|uniref:NmrA/HSCARG family protein n=1 Tax=Microbacterium sp. HD4P20 TaxID=2864874 RepID=UPI001C63BB1F|nr:NmrA/HSCARG family protein [Microbacterium sp. HD4P20]MCP2636017.1 NmrA/HSCARG family protein [Microbacterium sp. HD4P20]
MTTPQELPIAVIGATGHQGRSVINALHEFDVPIRALVRTPDAPAARALRESGVDVVHADQEDARSLADGLADVAALFFMTTFDGPDGTDGELRRGLAVADAAARANVPRVVYSSVGGAERATGIPHFESKFRVEQRLRGLVPTTVLRPVFFMENLAPQLTPNEDGEIVIRMPMPGDVPVQMIAVRDVGRAAARLLLDQTALDGDAIEVAGDELTLDLVAERTHEAFGVPARFESIPLAYLGDDEDLKAMFRWFAGGSAYHADLARSRSLIGDVGDLRSWLAAERQQGALAGGPRR